MLAGFSDTAFAEVSTLMTEFDLCPIRVDEPYTAMHMLLEDSGAWMACVLNARLFDDVARLQRFLQLLGHEGVPFGLIVANMPEDRRFCGATEAPELADAMIGDVADRRQMIPAMIAVLKRRCLLRDPAAEADTPVPDPRPAAAESGLIRGEELRLHRRRVLAAARANQYSEAELMAATQEPLPAATHIGPRPGALLN